MKLARLPFAIAVASALAFVLAARGFDSFVGVRSKVVDGLLPPTNGAVRLTVDARGTVARLRPPFALVARFDNDSPTPQTFTIAVDGATLCTPTIAAHATWFDRADCFITADWPAGATHTIVVTSTAPAWSLRYLELATHDGASSGADRIFIIPKTATPFSPPTTADVVVFWVLAVGLYLLPGPVRLPRAVKILYVIAATAIGILLVGIVLAPWVSKFSIVAGWATIARWAVILAVPALWRIGTIVVTRLRDRRSEWSALGRPAMVAAVVLLVFGIVMHARLEDSYLGNYSGFIQIGRVFVERSPYIANVPDVRRTLVIEEGGYDAQFMYYAAWDPLIRAYHANPAEFDGLYDTPPYRFGRIGYVWLTWLASLGDWRHFPKAMVWLDLGGIFLAAFATAVAAREVSANVLWGLVAIGVPAFWQSMETALPEPIAAAFLLLAFLVWRRGWWFRAALLLAASLLVRETGVLLVLVLTVAMFLRGERKQGFTMAAIAVAPVALWHIYVGWVLYPDWGMQGFFFNPQLLAVPFSGFIALWQHLRTGQYEMDLAKAAVWLPILLTLGWLLAVGAVLIRRTPLTIAAALYATVAISLNYDNVWVHTRNGERVTYEMFILLALISSEFASRSKFWRTSILAFWGLAVVYVLWFGFDGQFYRDTLLGPIL